MAIAYLFYCNIFVYLRENILGKLYFMPDSKEKLVLKYLCKVCSGKKTYLISPHDIAKATCGKMVLSVNEIDEIMTSLSLQNYIDFVVSDSKNGYFYCVKLSY